MATLSTWEASLVGRPARQATQLAGAAIALREATGRGEAFASAQARIATEARHYRDLVRWQEQIAFSALTGP